MTKMIGFVKIYKRLSFWLTMIATGVCLFNLFGYDDKSILLFLTSPPFWIIETNWFVENIVHPSKVSRGVIYIMTVVCWFFIGYMLDKFFAKLLNKGTEVKS